MAGRSAMSSKKRGKQRVEAQKRRKSKKPVVEKKREIGEGIIILLSFAGSLGVYLILYLIYS
ncbi:MAG: hypothetical protein ACOC5L_02895 [Halobacteriota archaeon]